MKLRHFLSQIQSPFFSTKFCYQTKLRVLISIMTQLFKILAEKYPDKAFWCQIQTFLFFRTILQLDKFEGADFKYDIIFSISRQNIPKSGIFGPKFRNFYFFIKFSKYTNLRVLISNMTIAFLRKWIPENIPIRNFWSKILKQGFVVPNLAIFVSSENFEVRLF